MKDNGKKEAVKEIKKIIERNEKDIFAFEKHTESDAYFEGRKITLEGANAELKWLLVLLGDEDE